MSLENNLQKQQEKPSFQDKISYSRLADEISLEENQENHVFGQHYLGNNILPQGHYQENIEEKHLLMHNQQGINIEINYSPQENYNQKDYYPSSNGRQSTRRQKKSNMHHSEHYKHQHVVIQPQINHLKKGSLSSIKQNDLEYKRSDDELCDYQPQQNNMLESVVDSSRKPHSIFPSNNIKKSCINNKKMTRSYHPKVNTAPESGVDQVYIRPIDDSREVDLQNLMQRNLEQDLQTLQIVPDRNQKLEKLKKSEEGRAILSSVVTQSQRNRQLSQPITYPKEQYSRNVEIRNSDGNVGSNKMFQKIQTIEKLVRQLQQKRRSPKNSTSKSKSNSATIKHTIEGEPYKVQRNKVNNVHTVSVVPQNSSVTDQLRGKWSNIALFNLQSILKNKIWNSIQGVSYPNKQFRQNIMIQILQFLQSPSPRTIQSQINQVIAKIAPELVAILTQQVFFIGIIKENHQKIFKVKGLEIHHNQYAYSGQFSKGLKSGEGRIFYVNHSSYSGEWYKDKFQGKGIFTQKNGDIYTGQFQKGLKSGKGKEVFQKGDHYHGYYSNNVFEGHGTYNWANRASYKGQFKKGMMSGHGHWISSKGDQYIGQFMQNVKDGWGIYRWKSGKVYEGYFQNGYQVKEKVKYERNIHYFDRSSQRRSSLDVQPFKFKEKKKVEFSDIPFKGLKTKRRSSVSNHKFRVFFNQ